MLQQEKRDSKGFRSDREEGFVLILAVAILMGMLAVVVTLAQTQRLSDGGFERVVKEQQSKSVLDFARKLPEAIIRNQNPYEMSRLQRNWMIPGVRRFPNPVKVLGRSTEGGDPIIQVDGLVHIFMNLAVGTNADGTKMVLTNDYNFTSSAVPNVENDSASYGGFDYELVTNNTFLIVGNELIHIDAGGTVTRGVAGVQATYRAGTPVFGVVKIIDATLGAADLGYLQVTHEVDDKELVTVWKNVDDWDVGDCDATTKKITDEFFRIGGDSGVPNNLRRIKKFLTTSIDSSEDIKNEPVPEGDGLFCTFDPGLDVAGRKAGFSVDFQNEQSKINLMGLSADALSIVYSGGYGNYENNIDPDKPFLYMPQAMAVLEQNKAILALSPLLTLYSDPDPRSEDWRWGYGVQTPGKIQELSGVPGDPFADITTNNGPNEVSNRLILRPPVNVNGASVGVMERAFSSHGLNADDALDLALDLQSYIGDAYESPDPFDGMRSNLNDGGRRSFVSPEEEFQAFLKRYTTDENRYAIMAHVYTESFYYGKVMQGKTIYGVGIPLVFEVGSAWTVEARASVGFKEKPGVNLYDKWIMKNVPFEDGEILLGGTNGWNPTFSTWYGVTGRKPVVTLADDVNNVIAFDETIMFGGESHVVANMYALTEPPQDDGNINGSFVMGPCVSPGVNPKFSVAGVAALGNLNYIDFGVRPYGETQVMIDEVDSPYSSYHFANDRDQNSFRETFSFLSTDGFPVTPGNTIMFLKYNDQKGRLDSGANIIDDSLLGQHLLFSSDGYGVDLLVEVTAINDRFTGNVSVSRVVDNLVGDLPATPAAGGSYHIIHGYSPSFLKQDGTKGEYVYNGAGSAVSHPGAFYETVVQVDGATFKPSEVQWVDSSELGGLAVEGQYWDGTLWDDLDNTSLTETGTTFQDSVRIRFLFLSPTIAPSNPTTWAAPQLFQVKVPYTIDVDVDNPMPMTIMLDRK